MTPSPMKFPTIGVSGFVVECFGRRCLFDAAVRHDRDAVGHRHCLGLIVGDVDDGGAGLAVHVDELVLHRGPQMDVKICQGFVEQEDPRFHDQASGQRDALALAPGQIRWTA